MDVTNSSQQWINRISQHPTWYAWLAYAVFLLCNNGVNASVVWSEATRDSANSLLWWEPVLWEYSSAVATLALTPLLFLSFDKEPLRFSQPLRQLLWHISAATLFCLTHVALMVALRELVYGLMGDDYQFGPWLRELWYEYRKDLWGYLNFLVMYQLIGVLWWRVRGEASVLADAPGGDAPWHSAGGSASDRLPSSNISDNLVPTVAQSHAPATPAPIQHLLVKKLDKEFLVKVTDIEYLESCGNYVNLHSQGRIYPLRSTLAQLALQLQSQGFYRVHRSFAVNHACIAELSYEPSGDGDIKLKSGVVLPLSRRYKDEFRAVWLPSKPSKTAPVKTNIEASP